MQGVEQFGYFAIQISMKMMTGPGEQFVIRRRTYAIIKKSFDANGISSSSDRAGRRGLRRCPPPRRARGWSRCYRHRRQDHGRGRGRLGVS